MSRGSNIFSKLIFGMAVVLSVGFFAVNTSYADGKATVTVDSVYVRSNASTSGQVVGGALKNDVMDVISSEQDSSGYTWYKVKLADGTTGFVRSDLVSTSGVSTDTTTQTAAPQPTVVVEQTVPTETEPVGGSVKGDVNVREGASTNHKVVDSAKMNTAVTVIGFATASDGKVWYNVKYSSSTGEKTGYIRSDFVSLQGELVEKGLVQEEPEPAPEPEPEPEPEPVEYKDFEAVKGDDGEWYLNNYIEGTRTKIGTLLEGQKIIEENQSKYNATVKKKNVAIIILTIVIVMLIGAGVYAYISVRHWYYGSDEETEEPVRVDTTRHTTSNVRPQTVGSTKPTVRSAVEPEQPVRVARSAEAVAQKSQAVRQSTLSGERLPDGSIRMPDGSIRKARVGYKLPDGSIRFEDGTIRRPDGTVVKETPVASKPRTYAGTSSHEVREVPFVRTSETNEDDMEYGFLNLDDNTEN